LVSFAAAFFKSYGKFPSCGAFADAAAALLLLLLLRCCCCCAAAAADCW
jgi:hypothetical protein